MEGYFTKWFDVKGYNRCLKKDKACMKKSLTYLVLKVYTSAFSKLI